MIKVIRTIKVNKNNWLFIVKDWITNHFGKNPKNGGSPPNDSKLKNKKNFIVFEWNDKVNNWFIWDVLNILNIKIIVKVKNV